MNPKSITMKELHDRIGHLGKNEIVLDVRRRDEFAEGHVPGAINIPHDEVAGHAKELIRYERIYMHCRSGRRVQVAHAELEKLGLKNIVCIPEGGMPDWMAAGYETVRGA